MSDEPTVTRRATLQSLVLGMGLVSTPAAGQGAGDGRTLVAFLSRSGNTRVIAGQLQRRLRGRPLRDPDRRALSRGLRGDGRAGGA